MWRTWCVYSRHLHGVIRPFKKGLPQIAMSGPDNYFRYAFCLWLHNMALEWENSCRIKSSFTLRQKEKLNRSTIIFHYDIICGKNMKIHHLLNEKTSMNMKFKSIRIKNLFKNDLARHLKFYSIQQTIFKSQWFFICFAFIMSLALSNWESNTHLTHSLRNKYSTEALFHWSIYAPEAAQAWTALPQSIWLPAKVLWVFFYLQFRKSTLDLKASLDWQYCLLYGEEFLCAEEARWN